MHEKTRPKKRKRISAFVKILAVLTAVCGALVAAGYYVISTVEPVEIDPPVAAGCKVRVDGATDPLEPEQAASAATVGGVAFSRDLPRHAVVVAYATVWQETKFFNIEYGDRDSLGLFQQRPSQEWGHPDQIMDPVYSSNEFYAHLEKVDSYADMPVYEAAQAVQRSADGFAYDQHEDRSRLMARAFTGAEGPAVTCWPEQPARTPGESPSPSPSPSAPPDVDGAVAEMKRVFGADPGALPPPGERPQTGDLGWAMALWAVANSEEYGITSVGYEDQRWTAEDGQEGWQSVPDRAPDGQVVLG
ncbi:hypothetical protein [Nocardiopsis suaedae]|uniref:ARB-07466-like C-terminal domain-containing protein n=1 Tax=Nocardiopsis suaedae TaxID=3018444 RepID=A0ABT4TTV6_9ACTN|nr:hypothetical protein [Nocardiopsis suaedae]MDA2808139.1 hypothetical protein [Nocardiopsis suaedae]